MNKLWIKHSHHEAITHRNEGPPFDSDHFVGYEYLDMMGLFETSWMIYEYHGSEDDHEYGYPGYE